MTKQQITNLLYWAAFASLALYFAYSRGWIMAPFESITPQQARELLRERDNVSLLDVRTPEEFSQGHIEGSTLIPVQVLEANLASLANVKDKKIIVYCRSGSRSVAASRILQKHGFVPLNIRGGIAQWENEGLPVVR